MSTALSSRTEPLTAAPGTSLLQEQVLRPVSDLRSLLAFRSAGLAAAGRMKLRIAGAVVLALTVAAAVIPAFVAEANDGLAKGKLIAVLPTIYLGFLVLTLVTAASAGGGREVVPRDQAVAFPVSSTTDHLGALLLAPLNIAWLLQAWTLIGMTAYVTGPRNLYLTELPVLLYLVLATALGQVLGWSLEYLRRGPNGALVVRSINATVIALVGVLVLTHHLTAVLDRSPTVRVFVAALNGPDPQFRVWVLPTLVIAVLAALAIVAGAVPAAYASRRAPRDEHRLESGTYQPRPNPLGDFRALVRADRVGVWRSVPLRRGLVVLGVMPGVIAFAGHLEWSKLTILPGLVASGAALLFGVNGWALDGRGGLWRASLPVAPSLVFRSRIWVLTEILLGTALITVLLGVVRAGLPTTSEVAALIGATVAVTGQVVSASMRWSVARPFAVDMKSARATPAPPVVMVGYSTRLALATTMVGLVFSGFAEVPQWWLSVGAAAFFVLISLLRTLRTAARWNDDETRATVIVTVAG